MALRPRVISTNSFGWRDPTGGHWIVTFTWAEVNGRPEVIGVNIRSHLDILYGDIRDGTAVVEVHPVGQPASMTRTVWRSFPAAQTIDKARRGSRRLLEKLAEEAPGSLEEKNRKDLELYREPDPRRGGRPRLYDQDHFRKVADVYRDAWRRSNSPTQTVASRFNVSPSTAAKWVKRARDMGFLGKTTAGRPGIGDSQTKKRRRR